ncbi:MAG: nuclear transport factor 2 family protein, partial [Sporomusa sp.]
MNNFEKEATIRHYFSMWVQRDFTSLNNIFAPDIYYSECYGPEYFGLQEIRYWIEDMLCKQHVFEWRIKQFIHENNNVVVEWYFKERQNKIDYAFDGVSIIQFQHGGKISSIK